MISRSDGEQDPERRAWLRLLGYAPESHYLVSKVRGVVPGLTVHRANGQPIKFFSRRQLMDMGREHQDRFNQLIKQEYALATRPRTGLLGRLRLIVAWVLWRLAMAFKPRAT